MNIAYLNRRMTIVVGESDAIKVSEMLAWPLDNGLCELCIVKDADFEGALTMIADKNGLVRKLTPEGWAQVMRSAPAEATSPETPAEQPSPESPAQNEQ